MTPIRWQRRNNPEFDESSSAVILTVTSAADAFSMPSSTRKPNPEPLPYHRAIVQHFQGEEPALWKWFAATRKRDKGAEAVRLDLLKSTYRLEPAAHASLYELAGSLCQRMGINSTFTLYQAQSGAALNASLAYFPGEAHVIVTGPLTEVLSQQEVRAVLAHELAHFLLFDGWHGDYFVAAELLRAISADASAGPAYLESARLYSLWAEVYADRWACHVCDDATAAISALIKIETGLSEVSAESYLRQAEEIFATSREQANQVTHPESYIRARALHLWAEQGEAAQDEIERMIEGPLAMRQLDLLGQKKLSGRTREFLHALLAQPWFHTEAALGHAKRFFPDFTPNSGAIDEDEWRETLRWSDASLRDYFCYLMLDFVTVDRDLSEVALAATLVLSRRLGLHERFAELAQRELSLGKKAFTKIDKEAETLLAKAAAQPS
jgi:Zn-dependent protease with chaperone function